MIQLTTKHFGIVRLSEEEAATLEVRLRTMAELHGISDVATLMLNQNDLDAFVLLRDSLAYLAMTNQNRGS